MDTSYLNSCGVLFNLSYTFVARTLEHHSGSTTYYLSNQNLWRQCTDSATGASYQVIDNLCSIKNIVDDANDLKHRVSSLDPDQDLIDQTKFTPPVAGCPWLTVSISGSKEYVEKVRSDVLKGYTSVTSRSIPLRGTDFGGIRTSKFVEKLNQISSYHRVEILIDNCATIGYQEPTILTQDWFVHIVGNQDNVNAAESAIRIVICCALTTASQHLEKVDYLLSQVTLVGGPDLILYNHIALQTGASIHIPDVLQNVFAPTSGTAGDAVSVWISAPSAAQTKYAKSTLEAIGRETCREYATRVILIPGVIIDHLLLHKQSDLIDIMLRRGVYIQLPRLGSQASRAVTFQSSSNNVRALHKCVADFCRLYEDVYSLEIDWAFSSDLEKTHACSVMHRLVRYKKTCSAAFNGPRVTVTGSSFEIRQLLEAYGTLVATDAVLAGSTDNAHIGLQVASDQRDFVSGKKNGKLSKITSRLNQQVEFTFAPFNDHDFTINVCLHDKSQFRKLSQAIDMLEKELPAYAEFHIPEVFHKSIIGSGGELIQAISKKYNVFIKFSNLTQTQGVRPLAFLREDNVLIKCPRKNAHSIGQVQQQVHDLVAVHCADTDTTSIPRTPTTNTYYTHIFQLLRGEFILLLESSKLDQIQKFEAQFGTYIEFPDSLQFYESQQLFSVKVRGAEAKVIECAENIRELMPQAYEFQITLSIDKFRATFTSAADNDFLQNLVIPLHVLLGFQITPVAVSGEDPEAHHQLILNYYDDGTKLSKAVDAVTAFVRERGFLILDRDVVSRKAQPIQETTRVDALRSRYKKTDRAAKTRSSKDVLAPITNQLLNRQSKPAGQFKRQEASLFDRPYVGSPASLQTVFTQMNNK